MIRHLAILAVVVSHCLTATAAPARNQPHEARQSDGTLLTLYLQGDEYAHRTVTLDGVGVTRQSNGDYYYQTTQCLAHNPSFRTAQEVAVVESLLQNPPVVPRSNKLRQTSLSAAAVFPSKPLVILVQFSDVSFTVGTRTHYDMQFNDLPTPFPSGSCRKWFADNSNNSYLPVFDLVGPITLSREVAYYGVNDVFGDDLRAVEMIVEACQLAQAAGVNFAHYDANNNGYVDNVYVLYAGRGESTPGVPAETIWPHRGYVTSSPLFDGKKLLDYACSNEHNKGKVEGIGLFVHEFSHVLSLPDLYDTDYATLTPLSYDLNHWSVMAYGLYNNNGITPCGYTAFEREYLGWDTPTLLSTPGEYALEPLSTTRQSYRINTSLPTEYFLLENRQQISGTWDASLPHHGMLIYHVDRSNSTVWRNNKINVSPTHQYLDIEEADNVRTLRTSPYAQYFESMQGDPFPGTSGNTSFGDDTTPNSLLWNGSRLDKPLANIREEGTTVYFDFSKTTNYIAEEPAPSITYYRSCGMLYIHNPEVETPIFLYTLQGELLGRYLIPLGDTSISLEQNHIVIIHIGGTRALLYP